MQIFIEDNKGNFIFREWDEEDMKKYKNKILELKNNGYELVNNDCDCLNQYEYYRNKARHELIVTILCC